MDNDPLFINGQLVADKYLIERLVGEGGFAVVYRALHTIWNKPVAIKFFNGLSSAPVEQRQKLQEAFIQEGALLTELSSQSASIVQARDVGTVTTPDGLWMPFMVLEWLEGSTLEHLIEKERSRGQATWTIEQTVRLLAPVAAGLEVAHRKGIAHRDVKPANLFVVGDPHSASAQVKVLDFGVAKMMADNSQLQAALAKTGTGITSFTPLYGAPEQFSRSHGATGPWTDVFALALVAAELLVGEVALQGDDIVQLAVSAGDPHRRPTPRTLGAPVSDDVEAVFARALAIKPSDRYASAGEFWSALEVAVGPIRSVSRPSSTAFDKTIRADAPVDAALQVTQTAVGLTGAPRVSGGAERARSKTGVFVGGALGLVVAAVGLAFVLRRPAEHQGAPSPTNEARPMAPRATASDAKPALVPTPEAPAKPSCPGGTTLIPAGQFFMGSDEKDAFDNEKPSHNVKLDAFCMDQNEVTMSEYKECSDKGQCRRAATEVDWPKISPKERKAFSPLCNAGKAERGDHPVNCVSWEMADTYCTAQHKRLPTEAEWEYATRGPDGRVYPWGDEAPTAQHLNACGTECVEWGKKNGIPLVALYDADDGYAGTAPVGKFPRGSSRFGPHDVVGNVWEWVADWSGGYKPDAVTNPTGPATGERRVIRGGAFNGSYAAWLRPSFRYAQAPEARSHAIGFRCAVGATPEGAQPSP